jgi:hypothetical protein
MVNDMWKSLLGTGFFKDEHQLKVYHKKFSNYLNIKGLVKGLQAVSFLRKVL